MKAWHPSTQSSSRLLVTVSDAQIDGLLILRWCFMSGNGTMGDVQYYSSTRILSMFRFSTCCISICNWVFTVLRMFLSSFIEFYIQFWCACGSHFWMFHTRLMLFAVLWLFFVHPLGSFIQVFLFFFMVHIFKNVF